MLGRRSAIIGGYLAFMLIVRIGLEAGQQIQTAPPVAVAPNDPTPAIPPPAAPTKPAIGILPVPNDAILLAQADAIEILKRGYYFVDVRSGPRFVAVSTRDLEYIRWIWVPHATDTDVKNIFLLIRAVSLALNYDSRASTMIWPIPVADGQLLRIDLRWYDPQNDGREWAKIWEEFGFDNSFAKNLTKDTIKFLAELDRPHRRVERIIPKVVERKVTRRVPVDQEWRTETQSIRHDGGDFAYPDDSGRVMKDLKANEPGQKYGFELRFKVGLPYKEVEEIVKETISEKIVEDVADLKDVDVVRVNRRDIDPVAFDNLQRATHSLAPVVEFRYLIQRGQTTINDEGPFKDIFGGKYYDLAGVRLAKDVKGAGKATDEDIFFADLSGDDINENLPGLATRIFDRTRADQRAVMGYSEVTSKKRRVDWLKVRNGRGVQSEGSITHDIRDQDIDRSQDPFENLVDFTDFAREAIFPSNNGLHKFALFNNKGARQDRVPPDVARDSTIPNSTQELQPAMGCIACHQTEGSNGWKSVVNEVPLLLGPLGANVFDDRDSAKAKRFKNRADLFDRLHGLYDGNFDKALQRGRDDLEESTLRAVQPWLNKDDDLNAIIKTDATNLVGIQRDYWYGRDKRRGVYPRDAVADLGFDVPADKAMELFLALVPPDPDNEFFGVLLEDSSVVRLKAGLPISRQDWDLRKPFVAERVAKNPAAQALRKKAP